MKRVMRVSSITSSVADVESSLCGIPVVNLRLLSEVSLAGRSGHWLMKSLSSHCISPTKPLLPRPWGNDGDEAEGTGGEAQRYPHQGTQRRYHSVCAFILQFEVICRGLVPLKAHCSSEIFPLYLLNMLTG